MGSSILGIGQSALAAAQVGLATTGHNIANANTPGYTRQVVVQTSAGAQNFGGGFLGKGTSVEAVRRVYDEYLNIQVQSAQTQKYGYDMYAGQIKQVEDMMANSQAGLAPALQDFFSSLQSLASSSGSAAARQTMLSSSEGLAARFQAMDTRLSDIRNGVESAIGDTIRTVNSYAKQIATLNDAIAKAQGPSGDQAPANDLLDQRDQLISELSKEIKVSYVKQGATYNVFIGNGQPLVVDTQTYDLVPTVSPIDGTRTEVGYATPTGTVVLDERNFTGGSLGGLLDFRANTLDPAQSQLGRVAVGLAMTFNAQHQLGQDRNGAMGTPFFKVGAPIINASTRNTGNEQLGVTLTNGTALTGSDYQVRFVGGQYDIVRLSDKAHVYTGAALPSGPVDGLSFSSLGGASADGDEFLVRPTMNGASVFSVLVNDVNKIAAGAPIRTSAATANTGTGKISLGTVNGPPPVNPNLQDPIKISFTSATSFTISGDPTTYTYTPGADITYNGWTVQISGSPAAGDGFSIDPNTNGTADGRNAVALAALQTKNMLAGGTTTYQGAYAQIVSAVGSKAHEIQVMGEAADNLLQSSTAAQQEKSGVNLDEEAANMLKYQQAYMAAGKIMQTASQLFELLLDIGH